MMTSNTLPGAAILQSSSQNSPGGSLSPKIPFENSKTMDECRIAVLRKFKKEVIETVRFSDVSETLIACGLVSKEECYEICKLSVSKQMLQCYQKVHDIMDILVFQKTNSNNNDENNDNNNAASKAKQSSASSSAMEEKQKGLVKEVWTNFVASLRKEHGQLATKMENELDKITENKLLLKRSTTGSKLRKADIGSPTDFKHIQHYGLITRSNSEPVVPLRSSKDRNRHKKLERRLSGLEEKTAGMPVTSLPKVEELNEKDPDLQEFFKRAGVAPRHLIDPVTREIILKFIKENGGIAAIRAEMRVPPSPQGSLTVDNQVTNSVDMHQVSQSQVNQTGEPNGTGTRPPEVLTPPPAPANVPFEPTPRPAPEHNLFYF